MWNCNNPYADRDQTLLRLGFKSYAEYTRSAFWKAIRVRVFSRAKKRCERCGSQRSLQVHHRAYDIATLAGSNIDSLTVACRRCHCRAERPTDFTRTRYERLIEASESVLETRPDWAETCMAWHHKHRKFLPLMEDREHVVEMVERYRQRATPAHGIPRCLVCGRKGTSPRVEPKTAGGYLFCGHHPWGVVRASLNALSLEVREKVLGAA